MTTLYHHLRRNAILLFWDTIIIILSRSRWVRLAIPYVYHLFRNRSDQYMMLASGALSLTGFICGFFLQALLL
jgi:hypothetical protein